MATTALTRGQADGSTRKSWRKACVHGPAVTRGLAARVRHVPSTAAAIRWLTRAVAFGCGSFGVSCSCGQGEVVAVAGLVGSLVFLPQVPGHLTSMAAAVLGLE